MIIIMMILMVMMNTEKSEALEDYLKGLIEIITKIRADYDFGERNNSYIKYKSRGDRYENLSPKEYLKMIRPYLSDLINNHKPTIKLTNRACNNDTERGE